MFQCYCFRNAYTHTKTETDRHRQTATDNGSHKITQNHRHKEIKRHRRTDFFHTLPTRTIRAFSALAAVDQTARHGFCPETGKRRRPAKCWKCCIMAAISYRVLCTSIIAGVRTQSHSVSQLFFLLFHLKLNCQLYGNRCLWQFLYRVHCASAKVQVHPVFRCLGHCRF